MKHCIKLDFVAAATLAIFAVVGCKKNSDEQTDLKKSAEAPQTPTGDSLSGSPNGGTAGTPSEKPADPTTGSPGGALLGTPEATPPEVTATTPGEEPTGEPTKDKDPSGEASGEPDDTPPFVPGEVSDVDSDGQPTTETLLAALPNTPHSTALRSGIDLSDQLIAALEGADDAPTALAALQALDSQFAAVAGEMQSLGAPDDESREQFGAVLRSKTELNARVRAEMKRLVKLDPTKPPEEASRQVNLESAQLYRTVSKLFGHFQKAWPTVHP